MSRRKVVVIVILAFFLVLLTTGVMAFDNEPDGFRGLKWEDSPTEEMEFLGEGRAKLEMYIRETDELSLEGVSLDNIVYSFYQDRFMRVNLHFTGIDNFSSLRIICIKRFGFKRAEPDKPFTYYREGSEANVFLSYAAVDDRGNLSLDSESLFSEYMEAVKQEKEKQSNTGW